MSSPFNRRQFLGFSAATAVATAAGFPSAANAAQRFPVPEPESLPAAYREMISARKNIILFMPDEMRADSLACYGNPIVHTPNFDRVAREGSRFETCMVQYPVCGASRCAMLTGWPTSVRGHRSLYYFLRPEEPNLFRYLKQSGYDVFWYGKNDALSQESFQDSVTETADGNGPVVGQQHSSTPMTPGALTMFFTAGGTRENNKDYFRLKMAQAILERKEQTKPFFIFMALTEPHPPYTAPEDFYNMYDPAKVPPPVPPVLKKKPYFHEGIRRRYHLGGIDEKTFRKIRAVYYGKVSYSDWLLGRLLETMEKTGHDKDTALLITSDHGDYTGDYGLIEKWPSGLEDCLTRVPLLVRVPGGKPGLVHKDPVEMYDVMQTSLDLAGVQAHHTHFSRSLLPQVSGGPGDPHRAAFAEGGYNVYEPQCFEAIGAGGGPYEGKISLQNYEPVSISRSSMVRTATHKLIMRPQDQCELYDITADPHETNNLYGEASSASLQHELQVKLLNHYINTTGIAPMDRDPRGTPKDGHFAPPSPPVRKDLTPAGWQQSILDA